MSTVALGPKGEIVVTGFLQADTGEEIEQLADELLASGSSLVVDLEGITHWDADGLDALHHALRAAAELGRQPALYEPPEALWQTLATRYPRLTPEFLIRTRRR